VGRESFVGIALPRGVDLLVALLAVVKAGGAYLPLEPELPAERVRLMVEDTKVRLTVTAGSPASGLPPEAGPFLLLDDENTQAALGAYGPGNLPYARPLPGNAAWVMYTSGSTGRPKGVAVPHRALINLLFGLRETLGSGPDDAWLWLTSLSFDIFALEAYLPLITGGRVVIAPEASSRDSATLVELIGKHAVTHVQATPSGWRMLLDGGFGESTVDRSVVALAGGEALPVPLAAQLRARVSRLFNVYGPTETTIWSTAAELPEQIDRVTIGRPIANTQIYLLDDQLRPVPIGLPGELCIGGAGVALGYLGRPELTDERFVADPFGSPGDRLYRTGDRARYLPDGRIVFLGRSDNQVKIRGHRVELGEIEARLLEHPDVAQAAVALHGGDDGDARLVGYLVPHGVAPAAAALRAQLALTLPAATVPSTWVILDRLPLTPNGKLDRAALPEPPRESAVEVGAPSEESADELTEQVRQIWQEVLQLEPIGLDDDLFDLGGHSLMITRIISRIRKQLGVNVPLDVFYDTPTIREVVAAMRRSAR
jgi:amino acid adenylation domain-containing protein